MSHLSNVKTDRTTLHVRDDGDGAPLVMLHGWPESSYRWEPVLPYLGPGFRLVRPDLRGLGDSARTLEMEAYQKAELAKDVIELLDTLGVERFGLVGHDWGGAVAQEIAIAAPERIMRLAIMNIHLLNNAAGYAAAAKVHASRLHRAYWYQYFMQTPGLCEVLLPGNEERWLRVFLRGKDKAWAFPPDAIAEYIRCYSIADTPTTGANYYRAMHLDAKRWGGLRDHRFDMPTLLLWGMHDPVVIPEFLIGHRDCFGDVRLERIEASHFLQKERPAEVGSALQSHFDPLLQVHAEPAISDRDST